MTRSRRGRADRDPGPRRRRRRGRGPGRAAAGPAGRDPARLPGAPGRADRRPDRHQGLPAAGRRGRRARPSTGPGSSCGGATSASCRPTTTTATPSRRWTCSPRRCVCDPDRVHPMPASDGGARPRRRRPRPTPPSSAPTDLRHLPARDGTGRPRRLDLPRAPVLVRRGRRDRRPLLAQAAAGADQPDPAGDQPARARSGSWSAAPTRRPPRRWPCSAPDRSRCRPPGSPGPSGPSG